MKKPNILLITADQMRSDALGCGGNAVVKTPSIDRLAGMGVNFKNAFTPDPICVPARASITTGCYPHRCTGVKSNAGSIRPGFPLLGGELKKRGYRTYAVGKLHYLPYMPPGKERTKHGIDSVELCESGRILKMYDPGGKTAGLEDYHDYLYGVGWGGYERGSGLGNNDIIASVSPLPEEHYADAWVASRAMANIDRHLQEKGSGEFFMWASFPKPHPAFDPPRPYDRMYDPREMPPPVGDIALIKERNLKFEYAKYMDNMWDLLSPEAKKTIKAAYYSLVSFQDVQVGRIMDFLAGKGLLENTVVIYTADHGELLGDFGLFHKSSFYGGSVRVPLIVYVPRMGKAGRRTNRLAGLQDILPTVLSLTGFPCESAVDGADLSPVLLEDGRVRDFYVSQCGDGENQQYMLFDGEWKYIYHACGGVEELYRADEDPRDLRNMARARGVEIRKVRERMKERLLGWCAEKEDAGILSGGGFAEYPFPAERSRGERAGSVFGRRFY